MSKLSQARHPAYHLRTNKAIDRLIFLDIIRALDQIRPVDDFTYFSFAGPFLEDARIVSQAFPRLAIISIENDEETYKRQLFHSFSRRFRPYHATFDDFLTNSYPSGCTIAWPDFVGFERPDLLQISDLTRRSSPWSLLRVTVEADTKVFDALDLLTKPTDLPAGKNEVFREYVEAFKKKYEMTGVAYDESMFTWENFQTKTYPDIVSHILISVINASCVQPKEFVPLHSVMYSDGTIMLSMTGVFCTNIDRPAIVKHFRRKGILKSGVRAIEVIDVPALTTKERLHIEQCLPSGTCSGKGARRKLGYLIEGDNSEEASLYKMRQYEIYHQYYPSFAKLQL